MELFKIKGDKAAYTRLPDTIEVEAAPVKKSCHGDYGSCPMCTDNCARAVKKKELAQALFQDSDGTWAISLILYSEKPDHPFCKKCIWPAPFNPTTGKYEVFDD